MSSSAEAPSRSPWTSVISALMHAFITGTGAAVSQISMAAAGGCSTTPSPTRPRRIRDRPARRLVGVAPGPGSNRTAGGASRGELYFMRATGLYAAHDSVSGAKYTLEIGLADQLSR